MDVPDTTKPTTASPPFDDPNADLVIRSSDGIHFYVHKLLLSLLSTALEGMFMIPNDSEQEVHDDKPCVSVSDDSHHLHCLLSWCDPRCMRSITSLDDMRTTLEMADKYGMDFILNLVEKTILSPGFKELMESEPLKLFAIALRFRLDKLALEAAKRTLQLPLLSQEIVCQISKCQDLKFISAFALQNLLDYHVRCTKRARQVVEQDDLKWAKTNPDGSKFTFVIGKRPTGTFFDTMPEPIHNHPNEPKGPRSQRSDPSTEWVGWWDGYMDKVSALLSQTPDGFVAQTRSLLRDTHLIIALGSCPTCKERGYEDLVVFSALLSKKINEAISQVPFHIEY